MRGRRAGVGREWLFHQDDVGIFLKGIFYIKYNGLRERGRLKRSRKDKIRLNYKVELHLNALKHRRVSRCNDSVTTVCVKTLLKTPPELI